MNHYLQPTRSLQAIHTPAQAKWRAESPPRATPPQAPQARQDHLNRPICANDGSAANGTAWGGPPGLREPKGDACIATRPDSVAIQRDEITQLPVAPPQNHQNAEV